jgi:predicted ABC-type exoprotein transport system permease subunit
MQEQNTKKKLILTILQLVIPILIALAIFYLSYLDMTHAIDNWLSFGTISILCILLLVSSIAGYLMRRKG